MNFALLQKSNILNFKQNIQEVRIHMFDQTALNADLVLLNELNIEH